MIHKKISYRQITDWLVEVGMLKLVENTTGTQRRRPTDSGEKLGISVDNRVGQHGPYQVVLYSEDAQRFIVDNVDAIVAYDSCKESKALKKSNIIHGHCSKKE